jgi:chemotaxis response regulator CheB
MPKEAITRGCVDRVVSLDQIAPEILRAATR